MVPAHWTWRVGPLTGDAVVFDLDGVLSDAAGRQHFLDRDTGRRDWKSFFAACGSDPMVAEIHQLLRLVDPSLRIVLLTARPLRVRAETLAWLSRYDVRWDLLVMRPDSDGRASENFKREALAGILDSGLKPLLAFEDDRRNVAMFRAENIPCVYIHSGYYE